MQALPSLHEAVLFGFRQPLRTSQTSSVQALPSEQAPLFATCAQLSDASLQESVVQATPSAQFGAVPAWQTPATQVSTPLQNWPSLHSASPVQPVTGAT